ncbi:MAG TPA: aminomethyl-transferring glycine dehydrogenase subunit GcvPB [bacterium]|nr:aminomethyl-transferring glycine dehydrogenase subunit GcvPB [bacterium]HPN43613.1 aminomethyl-transferring glycine dehydrogenase subunit GcvPB [bacterium]
MFKKLIFEMGSNGRSGCSLPKIDVPEVNISQLIPEKFQRKKAARLPQVSEFDVVRHFINLSTLNHHVDKGFYPLGSCTMKYNPKINEETQGLKGFSALHPHQPDATVQGALQLLYELAEYLCQVSGLAAVTLQPSAGAHGELTGLMMIKAYHEAQGGNRKIVLIPDSAHGTNPASVTIAGLQAVQIKSNAQGLVDLEDLKAHLNNETAALMLTNPNTLGIFETQVAEISRLVHKAGALLYMDGANLNALLGIVRPGDLGFDVVHFNLHKTFSTPHGGGGPGAGPVGVSERIRSFLPSPCVKKEKHGFTRTCEFSESIGKVSAFYGNFSILVRAYTYIRMLGATGLRQVSEGALINANYLLALLRDFYDLPYTRTPMHEFVLSGDRQKKFGVKTLDIAKRLLDYGVHAPTVYFPLIVSEALMIEPTETESKETLEQFADLLIKIAQEAEQTPELLKEAPVTTPVSRLNEALAARNLNVRYLFSD